MESNILESLGLRLTSMIILLKMGMLQRGASLGHSFLILLSGSKSIRGRI